jgi:hypothetical protein
MGARLKEVDAALTKALAAALHAGGVSGTFSLGQKSKRKFRLTVSAISLPWREAENGFASCA